MAARIRFASTLAAAALLNPTAAQSGNSTSGNSCQVRVAHELVSQKGVIQLRSATAAVLISAELNGLSAYAAAPCSGPAGLYVSDADGNRIADVLLPDAPAPSAYTVLAYKWAVTGDPATAVFPDMAAALPDHPYSISNAAVRFINAYAGSASVDVFGVTKDCFNCARPYLFSIPYGTATVTDTVWTDWYLSNTEYGMSIEVVPSTPGVTPPPFLPSVGDSGATARKGGAGYAGDLLLDEHGVYTLVIHDGQVLSWDINTDVAGRNQWLPLLYAFLSLVALGLGFHLLAFGMTQAAVGTAWGKAVAEGVAARKGKKGGDVTLLRFFGLDKRIAKAVEKAREKEKEEEGKSGGGLEDGLLAGAEGEGATATAPAAANLKAALSSGRFLSLDTLRGLCLIIMAFVNYGAGNYSFLDHAAWNGWHLADTVFPLFCWMSGVSMAVSFDSARKRGASRSDLAIKITSRGVKLFAAGLFMNGGAVIQQWRIIGVLQYFAVSNVIVGCLDALLHPTNKPAGPAKGEEGGSSDSGSLVSVFKRDVLSYWVQWSVMFTLLAIYLLVQAFLPLPEGCPTGYIGPGGLGDNGAYYGKGCTGGAHRVIDLAIFGANHIYHGVANDGTAVSAATCAAPYACDVHDPEGALGWLTAAWMVWLGMQAGRVLVNYKHVGASTGEGGSKGVDTAKLVRPYLTRLFTWGSILCLIGGALCGFAAEGGILPLNKNLWSPSFIACLSGVGFLMLGTLWVIIDHLRVWTGSPLRYVGMNSLAFYILHETYSSYFPMSYFGQYPGYGDPYGAAWYSHTEALGSNMAGVMSWVAVSRYLYCKGVFINV